MATKVSVGPGFKLVAAILCVIAVILVVRKWRGVLAPDRPHTTVSLNGAFPGVDGGRATAPAPAPTRGDLNRPLKVAINTWGGYAGGLLANGGLAPNRNSLFYRDFGLEVELILIDDFPQSRAAFRTGGEGGGVDVMWATVDSFALEAPGLEAQYHPQAFMQFDFSHGGDAIAAGPSIRTAADLRGKRVVYAEGTPSQYFLLYVLSQAGLTPQDIVPATVASATEAANVFKSGAADACVSWAPDVFQAAEQRRGGGGHILASTREATNLIADIFYARRDFLTAHPETMRRFVAGWMRGQAMAAANPGAAAAALARYFTNVSLEDGQAMLANARLTDYWDNVAFFEMSGDQPVGYADIFQSASGLWRQVGALTQVSQAYRAMDLRPLSGIRSLMGPPPSVPAPVGGTFTAPAPAAAPAVVTRRMSIYFATGSAALDPNMDLAVEQIANLAATFGGVQMRVAGNTDNTGSPAANIDLSRRRAQALVDELMRRNHFDPRKFVVVGNGPNVPVCRENTEDCRRRNRRTDLEILAPTDANGEADAGPVAAR